MGFRVKKQAVTLHYKKDKPTAYKLQLVREQTVKYKQLCKNIAASTGIRKGEVEDVLDALSQQMVQMMEMGHPVQLGVLGTFKPSLRMKCAEKKDELSAENIVGRRIQFIPGEIFKEMLADMDIETEADDDEDADEPADDNTEGEQTPDDGGDDNGGGNTGGGGGGQELS